MPKYEREFKCKICGYKRDVTTEEDEQMMTVPRVWEWPKHCDKTMSLHPYRATRYQFCTNASCVFAEGGQCACTCEGTFHGRESGRMQPARYIY